MSRRHLHLPANTGDKIADGVAATMGSWRFIIIQTAIVALWMILNSVAWAFHWDIFPFILLNLLFSTQAAYAAPIIMMSQNRQAARDRLRDDLEAQEVAELYSLNKRQLEILEILHKLQAQKKP